MAVEKFPRRVSGVADRPLQGRGAPRDASRLQLVHITDVGAAREILRSGQLDMRKCKVFEKELTYFFVYRPAYKPKDSGEPSEYVDEFPFVFVLDPKSLGAPYHVYPLDTGGAVAGAFNDAANRYAYLEDFALEETLEGAARHIDWAFGSSGAYYDGDLKPDLEAELPFHETVPRTFINIAKLAQRGHNRPDGRASAIEVAYRKHVRLKPNVKFAVLPRQFLEDPRGKNIPVIAALEEAGISWKHYEWRPICGPTIFTRKSIRSFASILSERGFYEVK